MTALERLERLAARVGWKLVWSTETDAAHPAHVYRVLDIGYRGRPILESGPDWVRTRREHLDRASEMIAERILSAASGRGARA